MDEKKVAVRLNRFWVQQLPDRKSVSHKAGAVIELSPAEAARLTAGPDPVASAVKPAAPAEASAKDDEIAEAATSDLTEQMRALVKKKQLGR